MYDNSAPGVATECDHAKRGGERLGPRLSLAAGSGLTFGSFGHQGFGCRVCHGAVENQMDKKRETDMAPLFRI